VRQNAGLSLARHRSRGELHRTRLSAHRARVTDQSRPVRTTVAQRVVWLKAIALGAPFHVWSAALVAAFSFAITTVYAAPGDWNEAFAEFERAWEGMVTSVAQRKVLFKTVAADG